MNGTIKIPEGLDARSRSRIPFGQKYALLKRLFKYAPIDRMELLAILVSAVIATFCSLWVPALIGHIIDAILKGFAPGIPGSGSVLDTLALLAFLFLLLAACSHYQIRLGARLAQRTGNSLRQSLVSKLLHVPIEYTDVHPHGDLMSRVTNDVDSVTGFVSQLLAAAISGVIALAGCAAILFLQDVTLALVNIGAAIVSVALTTILSGRMFKFFCKQQQSLGKMNHLVKESASGLRSILAFCKQDDQAARFAAQSDALMRDSTKVQILMGLMEPLMMFLGNASFLAVAVVGGGLALQGLISLGAVQSSILYARMFLKQVNDLGIMQNQLQGALASAERILEVLDEREEAAGGAVLSKEAFSGAISFRDVSFSYTRRKKVLDHLALEVQPGQTVAIVGATGAGKTTLASLLMRFYEPDEGSITIGGVDIASFPTRLLRKNCAIVLQNTSLLSDTVRNNIAYGKSDASVEMVMSSARAAHAHEFISMLSHGYETVLPYAGSMLSLGQQQLLCIARVLLQDPRIVILDEAMSSVDARTELLVRQAMNQLMKNRTCIVIAHRLSTIRSADHIVMLRDGKIIESGTHLELLAKRGPYYELCQHQLLCSTDEK